MVAYAVQEVDQLKSDQAVIHALAVAPAGQDPVLAQSRKMLRSNCLRRLRRGRDVPYTGFAALQEVDNPKADRVSCYAQYRGRVFEIAEWN